MNYEVKSVSASSIFLNAFRLFAFMGLIVALYTFWFSPNPAVHMMSVWMRLFAIGLFTLVYSLVIGTIMVMLSMLYNAWMREFNIRTFFMQVLWPSLIAGVFLGYTYGFISMGPERSWFARFGLMLVGSVVLTPLLAALTTLLTALGHAAFGPYRGAVLQLEQQDNSTQN